MMLAIIVFLDIVERHSSHAACQPQKTQNLSYQAARSQPTDGNRSCAATCSICLVHCVQLVTQPNTSASNRKPWKTPASIGSAETCRSPPILRSCKSSYHHGGPALCFLETSAELSHQKRSLHLSTPTLCRPLNAEISIRLR